MMRNYYLTGMVCFIMMASPFFILKAQDHLPVPKDPRISEISAMLPDQPRGFGAPVQNRELWGRFEGTGNERKIIEKAENYLDEPSPGVNRELWQQFVEGEIERQGYQEKYNLLTDRFATFVMAEIFENEGRFIPAVEKELKVFLDMGTWTHPTHLMGNEAPYEDFWEGREYYVDLYAAMNAFIISTADYWLNEKLDSNLRESLRDHMNRNIFQPYLKMLNTPGEEWWWMNATMNWNSVCTAGIVGAALTLMDDPEERAQFVAGAELSAPYFIKGFPVDGLCEENTGYWSYGFSHYLALNEIVRVNTQNRIDWMQGPKVARISLYPARSEILNGLYPSFSDANIYGRPSRWVKAFAEKRMGMSEVSLTQLAVQRLDDSDRLYLLGMLLSENIPVSTPEGELFEAGYHTPERDYFPEGGLLVLRPWERDPRGMGVSIKGGHNGAPHNHNDVGTFEIVKASEKLVIDPGSEIYGRKTFSDERYQSEIMNSFGHAVPVVAGQLQITGGDAKARVLEKSFSVPEDRIKFDLSSAYDVENLETLTRTFEYHRGEQATLMITDEVSYDNPRNFGVGLIVDTYIQSIQNKLSTSWRKTAPNTWEITKGDEGIEVVVTSKGEHPINFTQKSLEGFRIREGFQPVRLSFETAEPVEHAVIRMRISPIGND